MRDCRSARWASASLFLTGSETFAGLVQAAEQPADSWSMVCPDCVASEHDRRSNCRTCGRALTPATSEPAPEVRTESCPWCLLAERAGRELCDMCGRKTDSSSAAIPFWENV